MSLLLDKLAQARLRHPAAPIGQPIVCSGCGCDDDHACIDEGGRPCAWFALAVAAPFGLCSCCAAERGFGSFIDRF